MNKFQRDAWEEHKRFVKKIQRECTEEIESRLSKLFEIVNATGPGARVNIIIYSSDYAPNMYCIRLENLDIFLSDLMDTKEELLNTIKESEWNLTGEINAVQSL